MLNLLDIFDSIDLPIGLGNSIQYSAVPLPDYPHFHLAKNIQGLPTLMISIGEDLSKAITPSITLEHVSVNFDVACRITKSDGLILEGFFTVIHCTGWDKSLHTYFLHVIRLLFDLLPEPPTKLQVSKAIGTLVDLFQALSTPPRKTIQGLWAELFIIDLARRPDILVGAWHSTPVDRYDFNIGYERLEVKSTSQRIRQHHFSLEQVTPIADTQVIVASLFTEQVSNGLTVLQLTNRIRDKLSIYPSLVEHLDRIVVTTLGDSWQSALDDAFDSHLAISTLQFYDICNIPAPPFVLPNGVSNVHFRSDLSQCEPISIRQYGKKNPLFSALAKK